MHTLKGTSAVPSDPFPESVGLFGDSAETTLFVGGKTFHPVLGMNLYETLQRMFLHNNKLGF